MIVWRMHIACWISRLTRCTQIFTASLFARTRFDVTLYVHCLVYVFKKSWFFDASRIYLTMQLYLLHFSVIRLSLIVTVKCFVNDVARANRFCISDSDCRRAAVNVG